MSQTDSQLSSKVVPSEEVKDFIRSSTQNYGKVWEADYPRDLYGVSIPAFC